MTFAPYIEHGWHLCRIKSGEKGPRYRAWNARGIQPHEALHTPGAGLLHALSGTCAIDIDDLDMARAWLAQRGIDLDALMNAPDAVMIDSGRRGRAKLIYALRDPLPTQQITGTGGAMVLELRCATKDGLSVQDVLPPSVHPLTGQPYQWRYGDDLTGDWRALPALPEALHALWCSLLAPTPREQPTPAATPAQPSSAAPELLDAARDILAQTDPDCDYQTWLHLGMALEHDLGAAGWQLWLEWSAQGRKYPGEAQLQSHWSSFTQRGDGAITLGTFLLNRVATDDDFDVISDDELADDPFDEVFGSAKEPELKLWSLGDIQAQPWPTWLIRDVLPKAELSMVFGPSGAGKSFVVLDMALAIARGCPWWDHRTEQGTVIWLAAEAFGSMKPRTSAYALHHGLQPHELAALPFRVVEQFDLSNAPLVSSLIKAAKPLAPALIVVDTLAAASGGVDENSGADMGSVMDACRRLHHATGASVLLIHHSGKDAAKGARGWSGIRAAVQAELRVDYDVDADLRSLTATKQRDGEDGVAYGFKLVPYQVDTDEHGEPIASAAVSTTGLIEAPLKGDGGGQKRPSGTYNKLLWDAWLALAPEDEDGHVYCDALIQEAENAAGPRNAATRSALTRALAALSAQGFIRVDGDRVYHPGAAV